jgi:hypothetical protein
MSGLRNEIDKAADKTVTELTLEKIKEFMGELVAKSNPTTARDLIIHTGTGGMQRLNRLIKKNAYEDMLKNKKHKFSEKEYSTLQSMFNSEDMESFELAISIIDNTK